MQTRIEIERAAELLAMSLDGRLEPNQKFPPKVKHHLQGALQALQWILDHNDPGASSLKALLERAEEAHRAAGERLSLAE